MLRNKSSFSLWCDFIERDFIENEFLDLLECSAIQGATSNPSIFANAIISSDAYRGDITSMKNAKLSAKQIYENLALCDIRNVAKHLLPLWKSNKNSGFVSIEIDPNFCNDAAKSIDEGKRIYNTLDMPNVMIKIPATNAGFEVMNELYKSGINVNATLIFTKDQTKSCLEAFGNNRTKDLPKAVISVFVSRFDRVAQKGIKDKEPKLGIYNATKCYYAIEEFDNPHIRTLFASTGVKDSFIDSCYYVRELMFERAINTAPLDTIRSAIKQRVITTKLKSPPTKDTIESYLKDKDTNTIAKDLLDSGLGAFIDSFENMLKAI